MRILCSCTAFVLLVGILDARAVQSPEERITAREIVKKRSDSVVMVLATVKIHVTMNGTEQPALEQAVLTNATILDGTGLAVTSLSMIKPDETYERRLTAQVRAGTKVEVRSEVADLRMRLFDGREMPVKQVLTDEDLDLAFLRPVDAPAALLPFVDAPTVKPAMLDLLIMLQRAQESTGWQTAAAFASVQLVIDKPRTYYLVSGPSALGSPVFDATGKFVGVTVLRTTGARGTGAPAVLPAEDIRDVAKQAK